MESFTLRDFSGGLNTATDETSIPANMTASLLNIDFMSSGAITRRRGFTAITGTPIATSPVQALYRYYKRDGGRYWMGVTGSALFSSQYVASVTPWTTLEAENTTVTGSGTSDVSGALYSAGKAVRVPTSASFLVPKSTNISFYYRQSRCAASISIDGGAWVSDVAPHKGWSELTATQHVIRVKQPDNNVKSVLVTASGDTKASIYRDLPKTGVPYTLVMWMLDIDGTETMHQDNYYGVEVTDDTGIGYAVGGMGAAYGYTVAYAGYDNSLWSTVYDAQAVGNRQRKWWAIAFHCYGDRTEMYCDNQKLYTAYHSTPFYPKTIRGFCKSQTAGSYHVAFDDFRAQTAGNSGWWDASDIFSTLTAWTSHNTSPTAPAITGSYYNTYDESGWVLDVDRVRYAALETWTHQASFSASATQFAFATLNDECYFCTAYDGLRKFTGSAVSAVTASGTTKGDFLIEKGRRLFSTGDATDPNLLRWTSLDKPHDWTGGGYAYLSGKDSGGKPTGLAVWNDYLFAFTDSRTYVMSTTGIEENWESKVITTAHGCIAPRSIAVAANGIIFLSGDGVRGYGYLSGVYSDDGSAFYLLSGNIEPTIRDYTDEQKREAGGAVYDNRYWLSIGGDVYVCDLEKRTQNKQPPWTKYSGHDINCLAVTRADEYGLYSGSATDGTLYRLDYGDNDDGAAIPILYRTPPLAANGYTTVKHFRSTHLAADSPQEQEVTVTVTTDDVSPPPQTVTFDATTDIQPKRLVTSARGRSAQVTLQSEGVSQDLTISEITMTYNPKPRVR